MDTQQPRQRRSVSYYPIKEPTNRRLPPRLKETVPLAAQYDQLLAAEEKIDATITRKRFDMQDELNRPLKVARTMRIWCSNTVRDQAWQMTESGIEANNFDFESDSVPSWTLRIMAAILPDPNEEGDDKETPSTPVPKFTDLVRSVVIEEEATFEGLATDEPLLEYHKPPKTMGTPAPSMPGIELNRKGDADVRLKISIHLDNTPERYKLEPKLASILNLETATRQEIMSGLWDYVQAGKLQDSDEKRLIHADAPLREVFGLERLFFPDLPKMINKFLLPLDPVVLHYDVRTDQALTVAPHCWDVGVLVDSPVRAAYRSILNNLSAMASNPEMTALEQKIAATVLEVEASLAKKDFFESYAASPGDFINQWMASQNYDMEVLMGDVKKVSGEEARRAEYYTGDQDWLRESLFHYLSEERVV